MFPSYSSCFSDQELWTHPWHFAFSHTLHPIPYQILLFNILFINTSLLLPPGPTHHYFSPRLLQEPTTSLPASTVGLLHSIFHTGARIVLSNVSQIDPLASCLWLCSSNRRYWQEITQSMRRGEGPLFLLTASTGILPSAAGL